MNPIITTSFIVSGFFNLVMQRVTYFLQLFVTRKLDPSPGIVLIAGHDKNLLGGYRVHISQVIFLHIEATPCK